MARDLNRSLRDTAMVGPRPAAVDATDSDGDGVADVAELAVGSDPYDAGSQPLVLGAEPLDDGVVPDQTVVGTTLDQIVVDVTAMGDQLGIDVASITRLTDAFGNALGNDDALEDAGIDTTPLGDTPTGAGVIDDALTIGTAEPVRFGAGGFGGDASGTAEGATMGGTVDSDGATGDTSDVSIGLRNPKDMTLYAGDASGYVDKNGNTKAADLQALLGMGKESGGPTAADQVQARKDALTKPSDQAYQDWLKKTTPDGGTKLVNPDANDGSQTGPITQVQIDAAILRAGGAVSMPGVDAGDEIDTTGIDPSRPDEWDQVSLTTGDDTAWTAPSGAPHVPGSGFTDGPRPGSELELPPIPGGVLGGGDEGEGDDFGMPN